MEGVFCRSMSCFTRRNNNLNKQKQTTQSHLEVKSTHQLIQLPDFWMCMLEQHIKETEKANNPANDFPAVSTEVFV